MELPRTSFQLKFLNKSFTIKVTFTFYDYTFFCKKALFKPSIKTLTFSRFQYQNLLKYFLNKSFRVPIFCAYTNGEKNSSMCTS